ncbi:hypothetical protein [Brumimicrobium mesophilum]|uniref:hypothetical protein n=1 Tax=Brumimicrobium mesophilum TaxID=392717 RepID=UPI000D141DFB|nr:hypothetical protein [Brumimicrobium mesophilum]
MKNTNFIIQFFLIAFIGICVGCTKEKPSISENNINRTKSEFHGKWNLVQIFGGIVGANEQYALGDVTWLFGANDLIVENNGSSSVYYSLPTGTYQYDVIQANGNTYLSIDQSELGEFVIVGDTMNIDENSQSFGVGACGFYMKLQR